MRPVWVGFYCTALLYQTGTSIFSFLSKHLSGRAEEDGGIMETLFYKPKHLFELWGEEAVTKHAAFV